MVLEAASMSLSPAGAGEPVRDPTASRGSIIEIHSAAVASKTVVTPASQRLIIRAKGEPCDGAPVIDVAVDGHSVGTRSVSTSWTDYPLAAEIPTGSHTIAVTFADPLSSGSCTRSLSLDSVRIVPSGNIKAAPPVLGGAALFVGDYSTGDFSQWDVVQNRFYNSSGAGYTPTYAAAVVDDPVKGKAARFEVRDGDYPGFPSGDRSEVQGTTALSGGTEGQTRWYSFAVKFDPDFPQNHASLGWGVTNQWHCNCGGSPPVGWDVNEKNGQWSLIVHKQSAPNVVIDRVDIYDTPLQVGSWHDVTMEIRYSASDSDGYIRLWMNGVRQTFLDGSDTYTTRTMVPGTSGIYYKEGYYRQRGIAPTGVVYHAGFRAAASEGGLVG
ncbi:heparin lyase I family protein [Mycobacterium rufum]|uniref:Heparin lyase I family protein n=2 Tax=Mycolicibacterium rufum TaxID=318424 RepID=A0A9X2Y0N0_9MYCO|nr:heparin lyase I family protein [Mycolicibacterium rufum]